MRICIPVEKNEGENSKVYGHFGSAPCFVIYDTETKSVEAIENSNQHHTHGACNPLGAIEGKKVDVVVTGGMGMGAVMKLNAGGIKVYRSTLATVKDVAKEFTNGKMVELNSSNACASHGCH